jgi:hypothetical protein
LLKEIPILLATVSPLAGPGFFGLSSTGFFTVSANDLPQVVQRAFVTLAGIFFSSIVCFLLQWGQMTSILPPPNI